MKAKLLFALWGVLFILCAAFGFIPEPAGLMSALLTLCAVTCFLPPALILYRAKKTGDRHTLLLIRNLSALSLFATLILLILNFLSALSSALLGRILYYILVIVSSPMVCSGYWALSLFLWACLLTASSRVLKNT